MVVSPLFNMASSWIDNPTDKGWHKHQIKTIAPVWGATSLLLRVVRGAFRQLLGEVQFEQTTTTIRN